MQYESFYFIRPSRVLKDRLKKADPDIEEFMSQPLMWSKKEGGRTASTEEDYIAQVKLLFLLNLWSEYVVHVGEDPSLKLFLEEIIGYPPFNQELFDQWWTVERYEGVDECFEDVVEKLAMQDSQLLSESELPFAKAALSHLEEAVPA